METEQAETIALQALSFLAKDDELLSQFLTMTGITAHDLKKRFREPDLLGAVLDAILGNDTVLLGFCNAVSLSPDTLVKARRALPGGYENISHQ
jgi:hypothetical protein